MSWRIEVKAAAEKAYMKLDRETRQRVKKALLQLEASDDPFASANVRALTGQLRGDYRLRVGDLRVLFTPIKEERIISVYAILPRARAY